MLTLRRWWVELKRPMIARDGVNLAITAAGMLIAATVYLLTSISGLGDRLSDRIDVQWQHAMSMHEDDAHRITVLEEHDKLYGQSIDRLTTAIQNLTLSFASQNKK